MWYVIFVVIVIWFVYKYQKRKVVSWSLSVPRPADNDAWQEAKKQKTQSLKDLKKSFMRADNLQEAIKSADDIVKQFILNHGCSIAEIVGSYNEIELPGSISRRELILRKELNKCYKNRGDRISKVLSIYLALQHAKLQLAHADMEWKNFSGIQKLRSNLKSEEYFDSLLKLMFAFKGEFSGHVIAEKFSSDIERIFELWNSRNLAKEIYEENCAAYGKMLSASDKHFTISAIIGYLERRYKFNPQYRNKLISWCEKDAELYERFLVEFHEDQLFTIDEQSSFIENPTLKQKKLASISLDKVRCLKAYMVPSLNSYDALQFIYGQEHNNTKLAWLENIGKRIGY